MKSYAQFCALARALDLVGERWTLLVIRDLLGGPKRFTDLEAGLPGVSPTLLGGRLRELQKAGLVEQRRLPPPAASTVYELTPRGRALEEPLYALARWGASYGRERHPEDTPHPGGPDFALRALFHPAAARGVRTTYQLRLGNLNITARIEDGSLRLERGVTAAPDSTITSQRTTFIDVASGKLDLEEALATGALQITGDVAAGRRVFDFFHSGARSV